MHRDTDGGEEYLAASKLDATLDRASLLSLILLQSTYEESREFS